MRGSVISFACYLASAVVAVEYLLKALPNQLLFLFEHGVSIPAMAHWNAPKCLSYAFSYISSNYKMCLSPIPFLAAANFEKLVNIFGLEAQCAKHRSAVCLIFFCVSTPIAVFIREANPLWIAAGFLAQVAIPSYTFYRCEDICNKLDFIYQKTYASHSREGGSLLSLRIMKPETYQPFMQRL